MKIGDPKRFSAPEIFYFMWWEFVWHAKFREDAVIKAALQKSREFYEPWDLERYVHPESWWKGHAHLFSDCYTTRVLDPGELPAYADSVIIEVPLTRSPTELAREVQNLLVSALKEKKMPMPSKGKRKSTAQYSLSQNAEPKVLSIIDAHCVYLQRVRFPDLRGASLLEAVHRYYLEPGFDFMKIPLALQYDPRHPESKTRALRNMRRILQRAEKLIYNAACGDFPGTY